MNFRSNRVVCHFQPYSLDSVTGKSKIVLARIPLVAPNRNGIDASKENATCRDWLHY